MVKLFIVVDRVLICYGPVGGQLDSESSYFPSVLIIIALHAISDVNRNHNIVIVQFDADVQSYHTVTVFNFECELNVHYNEIL